MYIYYILYSILFIIYICQVWVASGGVHAKLVHDTQSAQHAQSKEHDT